MLCKDLAYLVQQLGTRLFKGVQLSNDPALSPLVMCEHQRTCGRASQVLKFSCTLGMAVGPGGVKHHCYLVSVCLGQRLRCREVRQQCAGGRAGGRVAKEGLELWERGRGDLLELVAASRDLSGQLLEVTHHHPQRSSIAIDEVHWLDRELFADHLV